MGLAAGIDYSLFLSTRFRAERELGLDSAAATITASHTAGKGVFIACTTTILALLGMFLLDDVKDADTMDNRGEPAKPTDF